MTNTIPPKNINEYNFIPFTLDVKYLLNERLTGKLFPVINLFFE